MDLDTRPYMRGLRNLAVATMRLTRYDEALAVCERLERECGDAAVAASFRSHIYLNMGRWADALEAAKAVVQIWPQHAYIAAFASWGMGEQREATRWFVHGALTRPRTGRMLLDLGDSEPSGFEGIEDHNTGVDMANNLVAYLERPSRNARRFFRRVLSAPTTSALLAEREEVTARRAEERATGNREAFDRMVEMGEIPFAREVAEQVLHEVTDRAPSR